MTELGFEAIDVDEHYYEPVDAFTRHLDPEFARRGVQMVKDGKRTVAIIGNRVNRFIPNPTFDPIILPGALDLMFRGELPEGTDRASLMKLEKLDLRPEYRDRAARVAVIESQGLETVFMFPTFGVGVEEALTDDIEATVASLHAFNLWLDEDWGFARPDNRIIAAPMISLADPAAAVAEVDFLLSRGARIVHVRPAPVPGVAKPRSLGHRDHDPVWARLAEADVPVAFHLGDSGYLKIAGMWGGTPTFEGFGGRDPLDLFLVDDRPIHDSMAAMIIHGVFDRHPTLRVASIENGSDWVAKLIKRLNKLANQQPRIFSHAPIDIVREHLWVSPYYEEDISRLAELIGVDRVLFGSDWPHAEGLESPLAFVRELKDLSEADIRKVMRDNANALLGAPVPTPA